MLSLNGSFFVQLGIVLVTMAFLYFLLFRPLGCRVDRRREAFASLEGDAARLEGEAAGAQADFQARLDGLKAEVLAYKAGIKADLDRERARIVGTAREKADITLRREAEDLRRELESAREDLRGRSRELAETVFARLMGRPPAPGRVC